jgi:hypothetical protein
VAFPPPSTAAGPWCRRAIPATSLLPYLVDARIRAEAAEAAQRHAARFSWTVTAQRTLAVYREVLRQHRAAQDPAGLGVAVPEAEAKGA